MRDHGAHGAPEPPNPGRRHPARARCRVRGVLRPLGVGGFASERPHQAGRDPGPVRRARNNRDAGALASLSTRTPSSWTGPARAGTTANPYARRSTPRPLHVHTPRLRRCARRSGASTRPSPQSSRWLSFSASRARSSSGHGIRSGLPPMPRPSASSICTGRSLRCGTCCSAVQASHHRQTCGLASPSGIGRRCRCCGDGGLGRARLPRRRSPPHRLHGHSRHTSR